MVAVKKIMSLDSPVVCIRTLREIKLLRHFGHENIISLLNVFPCHPSKEVYLVQELMPTDLNRVIRSQELSDDHYKYFTHQLLRGLKAIHSAGVLHRDLKPSNLLVHEQCHLKICDFGLARADANRQDRRAFMTEYVATRHYRAPEIMITFSEYTRAVDMWSVGCILAEMMLRKPIFPGQNYRHQLELIFQVIGSPSEEDYQAIISSRAGAYIKQMELRRGTSWNDFFPKASLACRDLLNRLLSFNPGKRVTVGDALSHAYVSGYHDPDDEPTARPVTEEFVSGNLDTERWMKGYLTRDTHYSPAQGV